MDIWIQILVILLQLYLLLCLSWFSHVCKENKILNLLEIYISENSSIIIPRCIGEPKGQKKSKWFFQANISSKKRTYEFNFTIMELVLVCFLEEMEDNKKKFGN